jgi:hypothetical protein
MMRVAMPASFFATGALSPLLLDAWPLATPLGFSATPFAVLSSLCCGIRSCLLAYSEEGVRRTGVACFVRAMAGRGGFQCARTLTTRF